MANKLKLFTILSAITAVVSGCASGPQTVTDWQYNPKLSRAKNIGNMFGYRAIKDQDAPKGMENGTFASDVIFNTASISAAYGSPFLPGASGWDAFGVGLGLSIAQAVFKPKEFWEVDNAFGFVPVKVANTPEKASEYLAKSIEGALVKAIEKQFPEYKIETFDKAAGWRDPNKSSWWDLPSYARVVHLVNPKDGCYPAKDYKERKDNMCWIQINVALPSEQIAMPSVINASGEQVWRITQEDIFEEDHLWALEFNSGSEVENMLPSHKLLPQAAKYMPKNTYLYLAPKSLNGKITPPMILEGDKSNLFVKPNQKTN